MSKQRNKRNTRRGRAKRWFKTPKYGFSSLGWIGRFGRFALVVPHDGGWWVIRGRSCDDLRFHSRAAAMRAAEYLARGR